MKKCIKIVCIALCISITMNLFSSYKKVEAVATTTAASAIVVYAVGAIIAALTTYFIVDNADEICNFVQSPAFGDTLTVDDDGTAAINPSAAIPDGISPVVFNALENEAVKATNSHIHFSNSGGEHGGGGKNRMPSGDYQNALSAAVTGLAAALISEGIEGIHQKNAYENVYGESGFMNRDIQVIDGKPQHVTSSYTPEHIQVFDDYGINYTILDNVSDTYFYSIRQDGNIIETNFDRDKYYQSFIIKDGKLYLLGDSDLAGVIRNGQNYYIGVHTLYPNGLYSLISDYTYQYKNAVFQFKLVNIDGNLFFANYESKASAENQVLFGYTDKNVFGRMFDSLYYDYTNYQFLEQVKFTSRPIIYSNILDRTDVLSADEAFYGEYEACGYIEGNSLYDFGVSTSLGQAAELIGGSDTLISGGHENTNTELTDLEKAIYALAQQHGIGYEQMLEQSQIIIDNGQIYIEGLDGISYSISSLVSEFDRLVEQGKITADQAAATTEQLKAVLDYLKTLNIEGIEIYIQQIEAALDDLKQGDENREALLGDISGTLSDMKKYLDTADLEGLTTSVGNIEAALNDLKDLINSLAVADDLVVSDIENISSDWYIEKFPFSLPFDFYRIITLFVRDPVEPVFTVPIETTIDVFGLNYVVDEEIVLDLTIFEVNGVDIVQVVLRFSCILGFVIMLILITTKFFV